MIDPVQTLIEYEIDKHLAGKHAQDAHSGKEARKNSVLRNRYAPGAIVGGLAGAVVGGVIGATTGTIGAAVPSLLLGGAVLADRSEKRQQALGKLSNVDANKQIFAESEHFGKDIATMGKVTNTAAHIGRAAGGAIGIGVGVRAGMNVGIAAQKKVEDTIKRILAKKRKGR